jgi:hypothetical protein
MPCEPIPSPWSWAWDRTMSEAPLSVALIFGAVAAVGDRIFGQPWLVAIGQGAFVFAVATLILFGRNRIRAKGAIARERAHRLAEWRSQFHTKIALERDQVDLYLVPRHPGSQTDFTLTVRDPSGSSTTAKPLGTSEGHEDFIGVAVDWQYPSGFAVPGSSLADGRYFAIWLADGHAEPIAERGFERREGAFSVEEPGYL